MPGEHLTRTRRNSDGLPASAVLSLWLGGVLRGAASPDEMLDHVQATAAVQVVHGLDTEPVGLVPALGELRRRGAVGCQLALPVPGEPAGLAGPAGFNRSALEAGEAVVVTGAGLGLVPEPIGSALEWSALEAHRPPPPDPALAGAQLRQELVAATSRLVALDVARWQPEVADVLSNVRHRPRAAVPPDVSPRVAETLDRALLCLEVVHLALDNEGGAVSASEGDQRRQALQPLSRAARHALISACSG